MVNPVLTLQFLNLLNDEELNTIMTLFAVEYTPIGDCDTPEEALQYFFSKTGNWVIAHEGNPIGFIALSPSKRHPGAYYQTTTYIFPQYRGLKYNQIIKDTFVQAFLRMETVKLCSVVRDWNVRSQRAMAKAFPTITPVKENRTENQKIKDPTLHQWFYDLSTAPYRELDDTELHIVFVLTEWLRIVHPTENTNITETIRVETQNLDEELRNQTSINCHVPTHPVS